MQPHHYTAQLIWTGNTGSGTASYTGYDRGYRIDFAGKPSLAGTADKMFRGDPAVHDPEEHFLAAISGCHLLTYLALCARHGVVVTAYHDDYSGVLEFNDQGGGAFTSVTLRPRVTIAAGSDPDLALSLHHTAHQQCYIAASCRVPINHEPTVTANGEQRTANG